MRPISLASIEFTAGILCNLDEGLAPNDPWGHRLIGSNRDATHRGDCTKECFTCSRCLYDAETVRAAKLLSALCIVNPSQGREDGGD